MSTPPCAADEIQRTAHLIAPHQTVETMLIAQARKKGRLRLQAAQV
jgi:hypothetical protein